MRARLDAFERQAYDLRRLRPRREYQWWDVPEAELGGAFQGWFHGSGYFDDASRGDPLYTRPFDNGRWMFVREGDRVQVTGMLTFSGDGPLLLLSTGPVDILPPPDLTASTVVSGVTRNFYEGVAEVDTIRFYQAWIPWFEYTCAGMSVGAGAIDRLEIGSYHKGDGINASDLWLATVVPNASKHKTVNFAPGNGLHDWGDLLPAGHTTTSGVTVGAAHHTGYDSYTGIAGEPAIASSAYREKAHLRYRITVSGTVSAWNPGGGGKVKWAPGTLDNQTVTRPDGISTEGKIAEGFRPETAQVIFGSVMGEEHPGHPFLILPSGEVLALPLSHPSWLMRFTGGLPDFGNYTFMDQSYPID